VAIPNWKVIDVLVECGFSKLANPTISEDQGPQLWYRHASDTFTQQKYMNLVKRHLNITVPEINII
jgi:hypothetical protein